MSCGMPRRPGGSPKASRRRLLSYDGSWALLRGFRPLALWGRSKLPQTLPLRPPTQASPGVSGQSRGAKDNLMDRIAASAESLAEIDSFQVQSQYVRIGGVRTHYVTAGTGPPVVLLAGLASSVRASWRRVLP